MPSIHILVVLTLIPAIALAYTCNYDSGLNEPYGSKTCSAANFCQTEVEYNINGEKIKTVKGCDDPRCTKTGCGDYANGGGDTGHSNICCCKGDYCNSATTKSLMALPFMCISYFLLK